MSPSISLAMSRAREASDAIHHRSCIACQLLGPPLCPACCRWLMSVHRHQMGWWVAGSYEGHLRSAILAYKRRGWLALDRPLGAMLAGAVVEHLRAGKHLRATEHTATSLIHLIPVPSHRDSLRERGVDAVHRLATCAVMDLRSRGLMASVAPLLVLAREYPRSSSGTVRSRQAVEGAFRVVPRRGLPGISAGVVVVVDDVITTGATASEAMRALTAAGLHPSGAVAVAGTERVKGARGMRASCDA